MSAPHLHLDAQVCFRLYTASRLVTQLYEPFFKRIGITYTQYLVLLVLWQQDAQPVNDIGKRLQLGISTTSPLIQRMERMGLVERRNNPNDRRQQIVVLTPQGKALEAEAETIPGCMHQKLNDCHLDDETLRSLAPILDELIAKITAQQA